MHINSNRITKCCSKLANILPTDPSLTLLLGSKGQNVVSSEHGHVAYQIKGNHQRQQHGSKYFPRILPPPPTLGMGSICQNSTFSEHGHAEYQIKSTHQMQQHGSNILPAYPLPEPRDGVNRSKFNFFKTWSCCISN